MVWPEPHTGPLQKDPPPPPPRSLNLALHGGHLMQCLTWGPDGEGGEGAAATREGGSAAVHQGPCVDFTKLGCPYSQTLFRPRGSCRGQCRAPIWHSRPDSCRVVAFTAGACRFSLPVLWLCDHRRIPGGSRHCSVSGCAWLWSIQDSGTEFHEVFTAGLAECPASGAPASPFCCIR